MNNNNVTCYMSLHEANLIKYMREVRLLLVKLNLAAI